VLSSGRPDDKSSILLTAFSLMANALLPLRQHYSRYQTAFSLTRATRLRRRRGGEQRRWTYTSPRSGKKWRITEDDVPVAPIVTRRIFAHDGTACSAAWRLYSQTCFAAATLPAGSLWRKTLQSPFRHSDIKTWKITHHLGRRAERFYRGEGRRKDEERSDKRHLMHRMPARIKRYGVRSIRKEL